MKILITGNAGFIGSWIADFLVSVGDEVYGIDDLSGGEIENVNEKVKFYKGDLSEDKTQKIVEKIAPEVIFYLAASAREGASQFEPVNSTKTNYWAYVKTLESAIKTKKLHKVVMFSSMAVYGNQKPPFTEDMKPRPEDIYGVSKYAMEEATKILGKVFDFGWTIIRPHNVFGERQRLNDPFRNVAGIFMNRIMRGEPFYIYGDGKQKRAFSYIEDCLRGFIICINDRFNGKIYNIGGDKVLTVNKLKDLIIKYFKKYSTYEIPNTVYLASRPQEVKYAYSSHKKAKKELYLQEKYGVKKGIERMVLWAIKQGAKEWRYEDLTLENEKLPKTWKEKL